MTGSWTQGPGSQKLPEQEGGLGSVLLVSTEPLSGQMWDS